MATELQPTSAFTLTQYCGPAPREPGDRRRLQVTQTEFYSESNMRSPGFVNMSKSEALELARALLDWVADDRLPDGGA